MHRLINQNKLLESKAFDEYLLRHEKTEGESRNTIQRLFICIANKTGRLKIINYKNYLIFF